jgi:ABC-type multidrug transport system fused ATPase/permease subunit
MARSSIYIKLCIAFIVFFLISLFLPGNGDSNLIEIILGAATFLFGIILAFSTANRHARFSAIRQGLREQDALLLSIYELSKVFDKKISEEIRSRIDALLMVQVDYKLVDFDKCVKKIEELYYYIEKIKVKNSNQERSLGFMFENAENLLKIEKEVSYHVKDRIMPYEWISLLVLSGVILFSLFYLMESNTISVIVIPLLSTTLILLLLVLEELDSLRWQEQNWIWDPLSNLFIELDLIPYFPEALFLQKRLKLESLKEIKEVRIAKFTNKYPNLEGKTIEIVKL